MDIVDRARLFATAAHEAAGNVRKYTFEPYIVHPAEFVEILKGVPHTDEMLAAAWLHDVVEDTEVKSGIMMEFLESIVNNDTANEIGKAVFLSHSKNRLNTTDQLVTM